MCGYGCADKSLPQATTGRVVPPTVSVVGSSSAVGQRSKPRQREVEVEEERTGSGRTTVASSNISRYAAIPQHVTYFTRNFVTSCSACVHYSVSFNIACKWRHPTHHLLWCSEREVTGIPTLKESIIPRERHDSFDSWPNSSRHEACALTLIAFSFLGTVLTTRHYTTGRAVLAVLLRLFTKTIVPTTCSLGGGMPAQVGCSCCCC